MQNLLHILSNMFADFWKKKDKELGINIYRDGLKIYTTLDYRLQTIAEKVTADQIIDKSTTI